MMSAKHRIVVIAAIFIALATFVYLRPLTLYFAARSIYIRAIGIESRYVRVGPHRIRYLTGGEGPPLVFVHGVATQAADSAPLFRPLMQGRRLYALDLLGYGESDKPRDAPYSVAMQGEIVRGFMDAAGLRNADMIGVSMGGWVALRVAAEHPARVRRLVLVSSAGLQYATNLTETSFSATTLDELRASLALQSDRLGWLPDFILRDMLRRSRRKAWVTRRSMRSMLAGSDLLDRKLGRVGMPVLLVWGTNDRIVPFSLAARMREEMPQARLVALEGCGHLAIIECREEAMAAIVSFLSSSRVDARGTPR